MVVAAGGAGARESVGTGGGGSGGQQRGGERREGRSRAAGAASEPESCSCRSPATPPCALCSGRKPPSLAGCRRTPRSGQEPGEKVRRKGHLSRSGLGEPSGAASRFPRTTSGRPGRSAGGAAPEQPGRDKGAGPEPCPRPLAPGGAARRRRRGGGCAARAAAQTLYKGASPARWRRRRRADATKVCSLLGAEGPPPRSAPHPGPPEPHLSDGGAQRLSSGGRLSPRCERRGAARTPVRRRRGPSSLARPLIARAASFA